MLVLVIQFFLVRMKISKVIDLKPFNPRYHLNIRISDLLLYSYFIKKMDYK